MFKFVFFEVSDGEEAEGLDALGADERGDFVDFDTESGGDVRERREEAVHEVPDGDDEFSGESGQGERSAFAHFESESPAVSGAVAMTEDTVSGLDEEGADVGTAVVRERACTAVLATAMDGGIEAEEGHELFWRGEAVDGADESGQSEGDEMLDAQETGQLEEFGIRRDFFGDEGVEAASLVFRLAVGGPGRFEDEFLAGRPVFEAKSLFQGERIREAKALGFRVTGSVEPGPETVFGAGGIFDAVAVGKEEFPTSGGFFVGSPDDTSQTAHIDPGDLNGIDFVGGTVGFSDLADGLAFQNDGDATATGQALNDREGVAASFEGNDVVGGDALGDDVFEAVHRLMVHDPFGLSLSGIGARQGGDREDVRMCVETNDALGSLFLFCLCHCCSFVTGVNGCRRPRCKQAYGVLSPTWVRSAGVQTLMRGVTPCSSSNVSRVATSRCSLSPTGRYNAPVTPTSSTFQ